LSNQVTLKGDVRTEHGKGPTGRLRRSGRVPAIMYGYQVEPTSLSVDARELYHALHTEAGRNVLIRLEIAGETHLTVARDMQWHPLRGETLHVDFLAVDRDSPISVEVPVLLVGDDEMDGAGVVNQQLYTVPMQVKPLDVPNSLELSIAGLTIGDVLRVEDLVGQLPEGAELDVDLDTTVVTINAPISEEALEALEEAAGVETEQPDTEEADDEAAEEPVDADEATAEDADEA
jgi:large subunit ribosomal protein L25